MELLGKLPSSFFDVPYVEAMVPGHRPQLGLSEGANCQRFAYEVLRYFGREVPDLRSSDLWTDQEFGAETDEPAPLDLVLFGASRDPWGAHVGVYLGGTRVLPLCQEIGAPTVWHFSDFAARKRYRTRIGFERVDLAVGFRPLRRADFASLARWFSEPRVARWWNADASLEGIEAKYGPRVDGVDVSTAMWIVEIGGRAGGLAQHYRISDHPAHDCAVGIENAVGVDFLLSEAFAGRGLGPAVLSRLSDLALARMPEANCCVATPAQGNRPSWRALERAGYSRHGTCHPPGEPPAFTYARPRSS